MLMSLHLKRSRRVTTFLKSKMSEKIISQNHVGKEFKNIVGESVKIISINAQGGAYPVNCVTDKGVLYTVNLFGKLISTAHVHHRDLVL